MHRLSPFRRNISSPGVSSSGLTTLAILILRRAGRPYYGLTVGGWAGGRAGGRRSGDPTIVKKAIIIRFKSAKNNILPATRRLRRKCRSRSPIRILQRKMLFYPADFFRNGDQSRTVFYASRRRILPKLLFSKLLRPREMRSLDVDEVQIVVDDYLQNCIRFGRILQSKVVIS